MLLERCYCDPRMLLECCWLVRLSESSSLVYLLETCTLIAIIPERLSHIHGDVEFYEVDVDDNEEIAEARRVSCKLYRRIYTQ